MFKLNEVVIHKSAGACVVCDIVTKNFGTGDTMYYLLKPKFPNLVNKALEIFLPVEKEKDFIRKPLTKTAVKYAAFSIWKITKSSWAQKQICLFSMIREMTHGRIRQHILTKTYPLE